MTKEKIIQLAEALASAGYEVKKIDTFYNTEQIEKYGNIEIFISPASQIKNPFSKERIIKLVEVLSSLDYGIVTYSLLCKYTYGDIRLVLQAL
jgi:hypothetical protein